MTAHHCPTGAHPEPSAWCYCHHRCRCFGCRLDHSARIAAWRRGEPTGTGPSADAARGLIAALVEAGASCSWIARESGVSRRTITSIRSGEFERVHPPTLRRLEGLARRVGSGDAIPPGYAEAVPDPDVRCVNYPECRRRNATKGRECKTCQRRRLAAA